MGQVSHPIESLFFGFCSCDIHAFIPSILLHLLTSVQLGLGLGHHQSAATVHWTIENAMQ